MSIRVALALGAAVAGLSLTQAAAQSGTIDNTTVQPWQTSCAPGACFAIRAITRPGPASATGETQQQVLAMLVVGVKADGGGILGAVVPLGAAIKPGARLLYGTQTLNVGVEVCLPDGCRATADPTPAQFDALQSTDKVELQFFAQNVPKPIITDFPLDGLTEVLATIREKVKTAP
ncbi:MAG TPA: invasion associated locus B family protein [Paenirhodobacter sp.]